MRVLQSSSFEPIIIESTANEANATLQLLFTSNADLSSVASGFSVNYESRTRCQAGKAIVVSGSSSCVSCLPGFYSPTGTAILNGCKPCPLRTYSDTPGASQCKACPAGTTYSDVGATSLFLCIFERRFFLARNGFDTWGNAVSQCQLQGGKIADILNSQENEMANQLRVQGPAGENTVAWLNVIAAYGAFHDPSTLRIYKGFMNFDPLNYTSPSTSSMLAVTMGPTGSWQFGLNSVAYLPLCVAYVCSATLGTNAGLYRQGPLCVNGKFCNASTQYIAAQLTWTSDRVCGNYTTCQQGQYEYVPSTLTSDRQCTAQTRECISQTEYESQPATATSMRVCVMQTTCTINQFVSANATATSDRRCRNSTVCVQGESTEVKMNSGWQDRVCLREFKWIFPPQKHISNF